MAYDYGKPYRYVNEKNVYEAKVFKVDETESDAPKSEILFDKAHRPHLVYFHPKKRSLFYAVLTKEDTFDLIPITQKPTEIWTLDARLDTNTANLHLAYYDIREHTVVYANNYTLPFTRARVDDNPTQRFRSVSLSFLGKMPEIFYLDSKRRLLHATYTNNYFRVLTLYDETPLQQVWADSARQGMRLVTQRRDGSLWYGIRTNEAFRFYPLPNASETTHFSARFDSEDAITVAYLKNEKEIHYFSYYEGDVLTRKVVTETKRITSLSLVLGGADVPYVLYATEDGVMHLALYDIENSVFRYFNLSKIGRCEGDISLGATHFSIYYAMFYYILYYDMVRGGLRFAKVRLINR